MPDIQATTYNPTNLPASLTVALTSAYTVIATLALFGKGDLVIGSIGNLTTDDMSDLIVDRQWFSGGPFLPWIGGTDWQTPTDKMRSSYNGTPGTGPADLTRAAGIVASDGFKYAHFDVKPGPCYAIRLRAKNVANAGNSKADVVLNARMRAS